MNWIIPANGKIYDHAGSFQKNGFIDWYQGKTKFEINDIVYVYCTVPLKRIMYKGIVEKTELARSQVFDDKIFWKDIKYYESRVSGRFFRLKLLKQVDTDYLSIESLNAIGIKGNIQSPRKITTEQALEIDKHFNDYYSNGFFADSIDEDIFEGIIHTIKVNKYERSSIARRKCIEYHGCKCSVCGIDFEKVYGELGKGFIHVHHTTPIHQIGKEYKIDYKNDLIPVCPNCHAMLHRSKNGDVLDYEYLKDLINNSNQNK